MVINQAKAKKSHTGGRLKRYRRKKLHEKGSTPIFTKLDEKRVYKAGTKGGGKKAKLLSADTANVFDSKAKKHFKLKIKNIVENPANIHYIRRNVITKGTVIETEKGKARITSRPGQDGCVNAVLLS